MPSDLKLLGLSVILTVCPSVITLEFVSHLYFKMSFSPSTSHGFAAIFHDYEQNFIPSLMSSNDLQSYPLCAVTHESDMKFSNK